MALEARGEGPELLVIFVQTPAENFQVSPKKLFAVSMPPKRITYPSAASYDIALRYREKPELVMLVHEGVPAANVDTPFEALSQ